jgi:hypothetical protein
MIHLRKKYKKFNDKIQNCEDDQSRASLEFFMEMFNSLKFGILVAILRLTFLFLYDNEERFKEITNSIKY